jgi:hypothetical protein
MICFGQIDLGNASDNEFTHSLFPGLVNWPSMSSTDLPDTPSTEYDLPVEGSKKSKIINPDSEYAFFLTPEEEYKDLKQALATGKSSVLRIALDRRLDPISIYRDILLDTELYESFKTGRMLATKTKWRYLTDGFKMDTVFEKVMSLLTGTRMSLDGSPYGHKSLAELLRKCAKDDGLFKQRPAFKEFLYTLNLKRALNSEVRKNPWGNMSMEDQYKTLKLLPSVLQSGLTVEQIACQCRLHPFNLYRIIQQYIEIQKSFKIGRGNQPTNWQDMKADRLRDAIFEGVLDNISDTTLRKKVEMSEYRWDEFRDENVEFMEFIQDLTIEVKTYNHKQTTIYGTNQAKKRPWDEITEVNTPESERKKRKMERSQQLTPRPQGETPEKIGGALF